MKIKATIVGFLAAGTLLISGVAQAAIIAPPPPDINGWNILPAKTFVDTFDNDASWTLVGFTIPGGTGLSVTEIEIAGRELYTVAFDFGVVGGLLPGTNLSIDYSMALTGPENFRHVSMDSTCPSATPNCTVTKDVTDGTFNPTLTSAGGQPSGSFTISGQLISVHEAFVVGTNGFLTNATNTFEVSGVPEPASLLLLGAGLLGLVAYRRTAR